MCRPFWDMQSGAQSVPEQEVLGAEVLRHMHVERLRSLLKSSCLGKDRQLVGGRAGRANEI